MPHWIIFLLCASGFLPKTAASVLQELNADTYTGSLEPGKTSLLYFSKTGKYSPGNAPFLDELGEAVKALQDYGVSVAKARFPPILCVCVRVSCSCSAFIVFPLSLSLRGSRLLRAFPPDTLFNVHAIVANVLFVLLYNEIRYITAAAEFHSIESTMKGKRNVVFVYVRAIGIPEHRAVMEAAFVYGSIYQFVLTTEAALLEDSDDVPAKLIYCHCKSVTSPTQGCQRTLSEQPLSTLSIHRFLKLMNAPLVVRTTTCFLFSVGWRA
uniref:Uncharacterized protein n=1 Tax=Leptobrachium leishanense TaxID=445787 RepID=A0A8C5QH87_9ANUR